MTRTRLWSSVTALTRVSRNRFAVAASTCVNSSSNWSINNNSCEPSFGNTRRSARCSPCSPASCSSREAGGSTATPSSASSSASNGWGAGVISIVNHESDKGSGPATDRREQPGLHDARLAAPARADHGDEPAAGPGLAETGDEPLDEPFPAVEVDGIGDVERPQSLVRVVDLDVRRSVRGRPLGRRDAAPSASWRSVTKVATFS